MNDSKWVAEVLERAREAKADPYRFSSLAYWLRLESWTRDEGILILADIDPRSIVDDEAERQSVLGLHLWEFDTAQPFSQPPNFTFEPYGATVPNPNCSDEINDGLLQRTEEVNAILESHRRKIDALCHVLDRSVEGLGDAVSRSASRVPLHSAAQFIAWATSIKYNIPWLEWAESRGLIGNEHGPFSAPFFDADAEDYPELLHIAVRAWQYARSATDGTPKQRVLDFLAERYSALPQGSREAIAQVVNWQRTGGRPTRKPRTGR